MCFFIGLKVYKIIEYDSYKILMYIYFEKMI